MSMTSLCHLAGFRAQIQACADPLHRDMPSDHPPDPDDTADFELSDQQALIDTFTVTCKFYGWALQGKPT